MKIIYKLHKINIENNFEKCYDVIEDNTLTIKLGMLKRRKDYEKNK